MALETFEFPGSSNLAGGSYDPETRALTIEFQSGSSYRYQGVPPDVVSALKSAASAGSFFYRAIRNRYAYEAV